MKDHHIHMQDNDSEGSYSTADNLTPRQNLTPQTSGTTSPNNLEHDYEGAAFKHAFDPPQAFDRIPLEEDYFTEDLPKSHGQSDRHEGGECDPGSECCAVLSQRPAVLMDKKTKIKLSALAAATLVDAAILDAKHLSLYPPRSHSLPPGPSDPISGILSAAHGTVGGVLMGVADYPIEISKMARARRDVVAGLATHFALYSGKGISRIVGTGLKAPMDMTVNISRGFGNVPRLYGDDTVRKEEKITGFASGLGAAGKGFGLGFYDGVTGLVTQPMNGAKKGGLGGFFAGVGKGIGGVVCKPASGAVGLAANTFKGVYEEDKNTREGIYKSSQMAEAKKESRDCSEDDRMTIIERWCDLAHSADMGEKAKYQ